MNGLFDQVELKMLDVLMKNGAITRKKYSVNDTDRKKYLKDVIRTLYLNQ